MGNCESCNQHEKNIQDVYKTPSQPQIQGFKEDSPYLDSPEIHSYHNHFDYPSDDKSVKKEQLNTPLNEIQSSNNLSSKVLPDGSNYEGKLNAQNLPNGQGKIRYQNGDVFEGFFV